MRKQIQYLEEFKSYLITRMSATPSELSLSKSISLISSGGNDIFDFFSQNNSPSSTEKEQFIETLLFNYKNHIRTLYSLGARKFVWIDVPPIGCCPYSRALSPLEGCIDGLNELARGFNEEVKTLMTDLSSTLPGMKHSIGSSYALILAIVANPNNHDVVIKSRMRVVELVNSMLKFYATLTPPTAQTDTATYSGTCYIHRMRRQRRPPCLLQWPVTVYLPDQCEAIDRGWC